ncbi:hypothetical protein [Halomonas sp. WWR20]
MKKIEESIYHCMDATALLLEKTVNPLHKAMLENYRKHVHLEGAGRFEEIVAPDMMADDPVYRITWGANPVVVKGRDGVLNFYRSVGEVVLWNTDNNISVADWGIADELTFHQLTTGRELLKLGFDIDEPEAYYHYESRQAFIWHYDSEARLKGEHLYEDKSSIVIERIPEEEIITPRQAQTLHLKRLTELTE